METINATATTLDPPELATGADKWLSEHRGKVANLAEEYATSQTELANVDDYRQAKRTRSALRKEIQTIDAERKAMTKDIEAAVKRFKDGAKDMLAPLTDLDARYKELADGFEQNVIEERKQTMAIAYHEMAPALVQLIPFSRICDLYADDGKWFRFSTNSQAALDDMSERIDAIASGEQTIRQMTWESKQELEHAVSVYFQTLDIGKTVQTITDERERQQQIQELQEMRESYVEPEPAPQVDIAPKQPVISEPEPMRQTYYFEFELTQEELADLMTFVKTRGIHGRRRKVA